MDAETAAELIKVGGALGFGLAFGASMWAAGVAILIGVLTKVGFYRWLDKVTGRED